MLDYMGYMFYNFLLITSKVFIKEFMVKYFIFLSIFLTFISVDVLQAASKSSTVDNLKISYKFDQKKDTIGEALDKLSKECGYTLAATKDKYVKDLLTSRLSLVQKNIQNMSLIRAIQSIVGHEFEVNVNKVKRTIYLTLKQQYEITFFLKRGYDLRISLPLKDRGLKSSIKNITEYALKHKIYYAVNFKDKREALAGSQRQADALALKDRKVFYAIAGDTIAQTISRWASYSGYSVYYTASKDLKIKSLAVFYGKFVDEKGVLNELLDVLSDNGFNIKAEFNSNNTLVIEDNNYSPILLSGVNNV